jgi:hypothetical protein
VVRRARVFTESPAGNIEARLATVLDLLRNEGAVAACFAFNNGHRVRFLGPAFFTKVLYFAGYESAAGAYRPLILDSVVSRALRSTGADGIMWPDHGWTTKVYGRYLSIVHEHAQAVGVLPDRVEAALFSRGRELARAQDTEPRVRASNEAIGPRTCPQLNLFTSFWSLVASPLP